MKSREKCRLEIDIYKTADFRFVQAIKKIIPPYFLPESANPEKTHHLQKFQA